MLYNYKNSMGMIECGEWEKQAGKQAGRPTDTQRARESHL